MPNNKNQSDKSIIDIELPGQKHQITLKHPPGTFALTPASNTAIQAIIKNHRLLSGIGLDWGSGVGCLAITAAKLECVEKVFGLEISKPDVDISTENARANCVSGITQFMLSDSYTPVSENDRTVLNEIEGKASFVLSNPPSSSGDDGFGFRREVMRGARRFLKNKGIVFLNVSFQYGQARLEQLTEEIPGYEYKGVLYSTECVPFDLGRPELLNCIELYAKEEDKGGMEYTFLNTGGPEASYINARTAFEHYRTTGESPLTKWQTHLFEFNYE